MTQNTAISGLIATVGLLLAAAPAAACRYVQPWAEVRTEWSKTNTTAGTVIAAKPFMTGTSCEGANDLALAQAITETLASGGIVLLGETHDNPQHHKLRAAMIEHAMKETTKKPAAVFEHIRTDQFAGLTTFAGDSARGGERGSAADLLRSLDWDKSGWPAATLFEPLFAAVLRAKLPILPGDAPRDTVRRVAREGLSALAATDVARFKLEQALPATLNDALLAELEASHCGLMPKTAFGNMAIAQRYRDAHIASQLSEAADKHGAAILFAGNGHIRADRGVPYYIKQMAPKRRVLTITLAEASKGQTDIKGYMPRNSDGQPAADFVVVTPTIQRDDPCNRMREQFGTKK